MSALSSILRDAVDGNGDKHLNFRCPGCDSVHGVLVDSVRGWGWNGDVNKPTFTPSLLVSYPANPEADEMFKEWRTARVCHSFIVDGKMQFLSDCTHALAGQTVDIPPFRHDTWVDAT